MGGGYSTQQKSFDDVDFYEDSDALCDDQSGGPVNVPSQPLTDKYTKYVDTNKGSVFYRYLNTSEGYEQDRLVKIPSDTTVEDFCTVYNAFYTPQAKLYHDESVCFVAFLAFLVLSIYKKNVFLFVAAAILFWRSSEPSTTQSFASFLQEAKDMPLSSMNLRTSVVGQNNNVLEQFKNNTLAMAHESVSAVAPSFDARQGMFVKPLMISENGVRTDMIIMLPNSKLDLHTHENTPTSAFALTNGLSVSFNGTNWRSWPINQTININPSTPHTIKSGSAGGTFITTHGGSIEDDYVPI
jgi:hypothetical protein